jgi:predicted transport protein
MSVSPLASKLRLKEGQRLAIMNAPDGYPEMLAPLPAGVSLSDAGTADCDQVHLFVRDSKELARLWPGAVAALKPDGALWAGFPKKSSGMETDLSRDEGWSAAFDTGWQGVGLISVDDTWTMMRLKRREHDAPGDLVAAQYAGQKAGLRPIYERLVAAALALGSDVELSPRKTYVALARGKQFAIIQPSTAARVDLGLRLKGRPTAGRLEAAGNFGSGSITHKVALASLEMVDDEVLGWLRAAYEAAGAERPAPIP